MPPSDGEHHAFGEQLAKHAPTAGANCGADGELALAHGRARQQQVRYVGAGDEENESDRAFQHQQFEPGVAYHGFAHGKHADAFGFVHPLRIGAAKLLADYFHFSAGLLDGDAGLESRGDREIVALIRALRIGLQRRPKIEAIRFGLKALGHHADHRVGALVEQDRLANDGRVAAEPSLPEGVTQHGRGSATGRSSASVKERP